MGMTVIVFNGTEPLEQIVNIISTEGPTRKLTKIVLLVSEKTYKDFTILYMYITGGGVGWVRRRVGGGEDPL